MALPKDHWIHKALAKEKARYQKKNAKTATGTPVDGAVSMASEGTPVGAAQPMAGRANAKC